MPKYEWQRSDYHEALREIAQNLLEAAECQRVRDAIFKVLTGDSDMALAHYPNLKQLMHQFGDPGYRENVISGDDPETGETKKDAHQYANEVFDFILRAVDAYKPE